MPTPEEIKKLSEQYAELTDGSPADKAYIRAITQCFAEWLCKTHCIVSKSKIQKLFGEYKTKRIEAALFGDDMTKYRHKIEVLTALFGKELFNEEKE